jgi:tetratricopeptide (TPR) repeat protein
MLYSIIPPILIVVSLVGIIVFLVKKSAKISEVREQLSREAAAGEENLAAEKGENSKWQKTQNGLLLLLEKLARLFKTFFLKLEVRFNDWIMALRNKRNKNINAETSLKKEEEVLQKVADYPQKELPKVETKKEEETKLLPEQKPIVTVAVPKEKVIRPMISEKVTSPKSKVETKSKLEELLIERVAANPKDLEAYERLGEYYMEIENFPDAKECFKQVLKLNPASRSIKYKIRRLERLLGE